MTTETPPNTPATPANDPTAAAPEAGAAPAADIGAAASTPAADPSPAAAAAATPSIADTFTAPVAQDTVAGAAADEPAAAVKPVEYTDFTQPEGFKLADAVVDNVREYGKKHGLSQEQAQELVNNAAVIEKGRFEVWSKAQDDAADAEYKAWETETNNDPDVGGKNLQQTTERIKTFVNRFVPDAKKSAELLKAINDSGLGVQLPFVKLLVEAAKPYENGSIEGSVAGGTNTKTFAQAAQEQYPNLNP